jgi:DNA-binding NarL/FixJ family response regulator
MEDSRAGVSPPFIPPHLNHILEQLAMGTTDMTASRRLHISPRTYSRRVATLLEILGANTRFQGGIEVVRLGILPVPMEPLFAQHRHEWDRSA